jgi:acetylglutamate kinase
MAVASACQATLLNFVSNVPGVLQDGHCLPHLTNAQTEALITNGVISEGMIPKVRAACTAVAKGVKQARIVNLAGLAEGGGTIFSNQ